MAQEDVLIKFEVDYSQLTKAQDQLEKTGNIDVTGFKQIQNAINTTATDTGGLIKKFKDVAGASVKMGKSVEDAFGSGIQDALQEAGVSVDEFSSALKKANTPAQTLKKELRDLKESLAQMKAAGKDTGTEFEALRARAGKLTDAIEDTNKEIKNAGSDTRNLDNVVGSISALAGGFAAAQGAAALLGDENEDLQKTLIKVQGAMALASGVQQFYNATLKEGSLAKLADSVATSSQVAVQRIYTAVTGQATAATTGFKVALAATGIGLFVVGVLALVDALTSTSNGLERVNNLIQSQTDFIELNNQAIKNSTDLRLAQLKAEGAAESDLVRVRGESLKQQFKGLRDNQDELIKERDNLEKVNKAVKDAGGTLDDFGKTFNVLNEQIGKNAPLLNDLANQIQITKLELTSALTSENQERIKKAEEANKKLKEQREKALREAKEARLQELRDTLAFLELDLLAVVKGGQDEINIRKKIVYQKSLIELEGEKLTSNQIKLIRAKAFQDRIDLQKQFNEKLTEDELQAQINTNKALLDGLNISNDQKLQLQVENLNTTALLEINKAKENAALILAIKAKLAADTRALNNEAIKQQLADDISSSAFTTNIIRTNLNKVAADRKNSTDQRIAAVRALEITELGLLQKEIDANEKLQQSDNEVQKNRERLAERRVAIEGETQKKIDDINQQAIDSQRESIDKIIQATSQLGNIFSQISQQQTDIESQRIASRRKDLEDQLAAGAISKKEAEARAKQIDTIERQARQRAAQREKQAAVFQSVLAIPQAYLAGLKTSIPLGIIMAALAAAQAAIIASRPVPKFFRGKRDNYSGPGIVGDMGSELVERGGRMFLYTKPTQTYLGATDKVYTAAQTRTILHDTTNVQQVVTAKTERFDYAKFSASIPANSININIDKEFISESVANGLNKTNYMGRRYSSQ